MEISNDQKNYLWQHFQFNADQRLKAFNFFVVLSVFANGGVFTALDKSFHPCVLALIGGFVMVLSVVFYVIDLRSKELLALTVPGLQAYEQQLPEALRVFTNEADNRRFIPKYTVAFRTLFGLQFLFGAGVVIFACWTWMRPVL
jgi:hypothetical protein